MRWLVVLVFALSGCANQYFRDAGAPPAPSDITLETWPNRELWTGVVFNGDKIGFTKRTLRPTAGGLYEIESEAAMVRSVKNYKAGFVVSDSNLRPEATHTIDIEDFVDLADIDPVSFERSYVLAPQYGSEKPYALLLRAMEEAGQVGIGRFVLRTKQHLAAIRPREGAIGLETLFYGDEVRPVEEFGNLPVRAEVSDREVGMARQLIDRAAEQ